MTLATIVRPLQLSEHFSVAEFTATEHRRFDNSLPAELLPNAKRTCAMLERIRAFLSEQLGVDVPIGLSSGYRCPALNRAIGGSAHSDHCQALAADWNARRYGPPFTVALALATQLDKLRVGQLILEYPTLAGGGWIHTSEPEPAKAVNRILTIDRHQGKKRVRVGIHKPTA